MLKYKFIFLGIFVCSLCHAGAWATGGNARHAALGGAGVGLSGFSSLFYNQAGMTSVESITAGINYENRFLLQELSTCSFGLLIPVKSGSLGMSIKRFGYSAYSENKYALAYARKFTEKFSAGIQLDYLHTQIAGEYASFSQLCFEAGFLLSLSEKTLLAVHAFNPLNVDLIDKEDWEQLPVVLSLGMVHHFSDNLLATLEAEKHNLYPVSVKAGLEYTAGGCISLRIGFCNDPSCFSFGCGFKLKKLRIDVASVYHQVLGFSPQLSTIYAFVK